MVTPAPIPVVSGVAMKHRLRSQSNVHRNRTKARNIMSAVSNHEVRWERLDVNPMLMVRQSDRTRRA